MRRIFTLAVGWLLLIGLTACGNSTASQAESSSSQTKSAVSNAASYSSSADESLRSIELVNTSVENWDAYDTVFIGYPIWWGIAAWPVNEFITSNDFSDKTIIPFCTSASSGIGESATLLSEMAGTGNWQDGYRFSSSASDSEIIEWLATLNY